MLPCGALLLKRRLLNMQGGRRGMHLDLAVLQRKRLHQRNVHRVRCRWQRLHHRCAVLLAALVRAARRRGLHELQETRRRMHPRRRLLLKLLRRADLFVQDIGRTLHKQPQLLHRADMHNRALQLNRYEGPYNLHHRHQIARGLILFHADRCLHCPFHPNLIS